MKISISQYRLISFGLLLTIYCSGCQPAAPTATEAETATSVAADRAQIVMLTQTVKYDSDQKAEICSEYVAHQSVVVSASLCSQNKWFMFEGPVLENDFIAYRYYADSRHRFDIYSKTVTDLVMDTVSWDYHNIMNWGVQSFKEEELGIAITISLDQKPEAISEELSRAYVFRQAPQEASYRFLAA